MLHKFQAELKQSPPVTMLHTLSCPVCSTTASLLRVVRGRNVSDAVLGLIEAYMTADVRRTVTVCRCTKGERPETE